MCVCHLQCALQYLEPTEKIGKQKEQMELAAQKMSSKIKQVLTTEECAQKLKGFYKNYRSPNGHWHSLREQHTGHPDQGESVLDQIQRDVILNAAAMNTHGNDLQTVKTDTPTHSSLSSKTTTSSTQERLQESSMQIDTYANVRDEQKEANDIEELVNEIESWEGGSYE